MDLYNQKDPVNMQKYEAALSAGYTPEEVDSFLKSKGENPDNYRLSKGKKVIKKLADFAPGVMSGTGAVAGGVFGSVIPVAGTTTGSVLGAAGGYGAGTAVKESIYDALGIRSKSQKQLATESIAGPATAAASSIAVPAILNTGAKILAPVVNPSLKVVKDAFNPEILKKMLKMKTLSPGKASGQFGTDAAVEATKQGTKFSRPMFYSDIIDRVKAVSSDTQRANMENKVISSISKELKIQPSNLKNLSFDELQQILPDLFKGKTTKTVESALSARRNEASSAFAGLLKSVLKPGNKQMELIRNAAYNEQLKKIPGINTADTTIKAIKTLEKVFGAGIAYKLLFGSKGSAAQKVVETATSL